MGSVFSSNLLVSLCKALDWFLSLLCISLPSKFFFAGPLSTLSVVCVLCLQGIIRWHDNNVTPWIRPLEKGLPRRLFSFWASSSLRTTHFPKDRGLPPPGCAMPSKPPGQSYFSFGASLQTSEQISSTWKWVLRSPFIPYLTVDKGKPLEPPFLL